MQDFTNADKDLSVTANLSATDSVIQNEYGGIYDKPKPRKIGFIEARKNSDNFWNLMFWVCTTAGWVLSAFFGKKYPTLAFICSWSTIIGVPLLVKWQSRLTFDEEKGFFSKDGRSLANSYPKKFGLALFAAIGITAFLGLILDKSAPNLNDILSRLLIFGTFFFVITLYFILINCPIAILFSKYIWSSKISGIEASRSHYHHSHFLTSNSHKSSLSPRSWSTDPSYKHLSSNIHHRR